MTMAGIVMILAAALFVIVVEAAARGNLGINPMMGYRFGPLMTAESAWAAGHKAARIPTCAAGAVLLIGGALIALVPMGEDRGGTIVLGSFVIVAVLVAIAAWLAYRAAALALAAELNHGVHDSSESLTK